MFLKKNEQRRETDSDSKGLCNIADAQVKAKKDMLLSCLKQAEFVSTRQKELQRKRELAEQALGGMERFGAELFCHPIVQACEQSMVSISRMQFWVKF